MVRFRSQSFYPRRKHHRLPFSRRLGVAIAFPEASKIKNCSACLENEDDSIVFHLVI